MSRGKESKLEKTNPVGDFIIDMLGLAYFTGVIIKEQIIKHNWYHLWKISHVEERDFDGTIVRYKR